MAEKTLICPQCGGGLAYIGGHPSEEGKGVFTCSDCDNFLAKEYPEGWIDPFEGHWRQKARVQRKGVLFDDTVEKDRVEEAALAIINVDAAKLDPELLQVMTARVTVLTFLRNLRSSRPQVRQRAAEALARYSLKMPATKLEVEDNTAMTPEKVAETQVKLDRLKELQTKRDAS